MKKHVLSLISKAGLITALALFITASLPLTAAAATSKPSGEITTSTSTSTKPVIRGEAEDVKKVAVTIYKEDSEKVLFQKKNVIVNKKTDGWKVNVSKKLPNGTYTVKLTTGSGKSMQTLDTQTFTIGKVTKSKKSKTKEIESAPVAGSVTVTTIPLLMGGTVRGGDSAPIAYLQVKNTGKDIVKMEGFTVKQNGTASTDLITSLSSVDDKGASRATSKAMPFKNGSAFVPSTATIAPGTSKLFTIKANMAANLLSALGKDLRLDVTGVQTSGAEKASFPLRGTMFTVGA